MAHAEKTVVIRRPVGTVFDFVLDGAGNKLWRSTVVDVQPVSPLPFGVGSKFRQGVKGPGGRIDADYEITQCDPNERIAFQVTDGPARPKGVYRFQSKRGETQLTLTLDLSTDEISKRIDPVVSTALFRDAARDVGLQAVAGLSPQDRQLVEPLAAGKSHQEIARSTLLGEGTLRNLVFSVYSKLLEAWFQRTLQAEVGMLDELKILLEKHA